MPVWTLTREDITLLIAIAGFLMSLYNCVKTIWDSRCGLSVIYKSHYCASYPNGKTMLLIHLLFENLSAKPYSVTRIFLQADGSEYEFAFPSQEIWEFTRREGENVIKRSEVMSQKLPFRVEGYGAAGGYFVVFIPKELAASFSCSTNISLRIHTNLKKKDISIMASNYDNDIENYGSYTKNQSQIFNRHS